MSENELLRLVAAAEGESEHPLAEAIVKAARQRGLTPPAVETFEAVPGHGALATVEGHRLVIGNQRLLDREHVSLDGLRARVDELAGEGRTAVQVAIDGRPAAVIAIADAPRETAAEAIAALKQLGVRPVMLSGDARATAERIAGELGIDEVIAEVLPADKVDVVARLQREGRVVAMVGDGVNDAAALARADLGLAMGTGTDVAIEASDLTLVRGDLRAAVDAIRLSRKTLGTIKGNLFWAFAYNVAALPLAALGLLNPMIAGAAMACSSLFVVSNSLRLRRFR
jgi:Cu+-exporting ATPase